MNECFFCTHKTNPSFKDIANLSKFLTPRKKVMASEKTATCAKHQRILSKQIKYARFLGLISYVSYQRA